MPDVYQVVRQLVVDGHYAPGERIAEIPLAERLHVSRTPVRAVLQRLVIEGLAVESKRGVVVAELDLPSLVQAYEVREALEAMAAAAAARRQQAGEIAPAALDAIERGVRDTQDATLRGDDDVAMRGNEQFHSAIVELAGNRFLRKALTELWALIRVSTSASLAPAGRRSTVDDEHHELLRAIRAGDEHAASMLAAAHVRRTIAALAG
jgi:DNA-binding GntR family transcriptional regulator